MPKTYTVKECTELDDGDVIGEVSGLMVSIMKPLPNDNGTIQNGKIRGEDGTEFKITFVDNPQNEKTAKGKRITIKSTKSDKHGWLGCKIKDSGAKYGRAIWVTGTSIIKYEGEDESEQERTEPAKTQKPPQDKPRTTDTGTNSRPPEVIKPARWHVENLADLFATCVSLVNEIVMPKAIGADNPTDDAKLEIAQAYATSLFIQCDRNGLMRAWDKDFVPKIPVPPPERWREAVLLSGEFKGKTLAELPHDKLLVLFDYYDQKGSNTPFAECVYAAAEELKLLKIPKDEIIPDLPDDPAEDGEDIPFLWILPFFFLISMGAFT